MRPQRLAARKGQQLPHERGRAVGVLLNLINVPERWIGRPVVAEKQAAIADDRGQDIIEIMRHSAGKLSDRLHFLGLCEVALQSPLFGGVERVNRRAVPVVLVRCREKQPCRPLASPSQGGIDRRYSWRRLEGRVNGGIDGGVVAIEDTGKDRARGAVGLLQRLRHEARESGVGTGDPSALVEHGDRNRRRIEYPCEAHFRRAQILLRFLARSAAEDERARRPWCAVLTERDAVEQTHGQALSIAAFQVDIELLGTDLAGASGGRSDERGGGAGHEVGQLETSGAGLRRVVTEPGGKGSVHIRNVAVPAAGKKSGWRVV